MLRCTLGRLAQAALLSVLCTALPVHAAVLEYPLAGHFDLYEGTLELWFSPTIELRALPATHYQRLLTLVQINVERGFAITGHLFSRDRKLGLAFSMVDSEGKDGLTSMIGRPDPLLPGILYHLALSWRGREVALYLNGQLVAERLQNAPFSGKVAGQKLYVGDPKRPSTPIVLQALRMSSVARDATELPSSRPCIDEYTLLLDRFDSPAHIHRNGATKAQVAAGIADSPGGIVRGSWRFLPGRAGGIVLDRQAGE